MDRSEENKLVDLKEMVIERILKNVSYRWGNDNELFAKEGMKVFLTEEIIDLMVDKNKFQLWNIFGDLIESYTVSYSAVQNSLDRLYTLVSDQVGRGGEKWKGHRVVCWAVGWMVEYCKEEWSDETTAFVVDYLVKVIDECEDMEMVKWAILTGERWWVEMKMKISRERRGRLRTALTRHSQTQADSEDGDIDMNGWDVERYQVKWCARWCKDNLVENEVVKIPYVKQSRDRFEARNDNDEHLTRRTYFFDQLTTFVPVRSQFSVKSNVYFYEVTCVTNGEMEFGWENREIQDRANGIGKNEISAWLKVCENFYTCLTNQQHQIPTPPSHCPLNVVGCLLDVNNEQLKFYLNGRPIVCPKPPHYDIDGIRRFPKKISPPYFATAYLSPHQQCHFNFGLTPFKFPPQNIQFTTFHEQTGGDESKYRLMDTEKWGDDFWFAHTPVDNQVSSVFDDEMQKEVDREVRRVVEDIENDRDIVEIIIWKVRDFFGEYSWRGFRYIQAIIGVMGNGGGEDKVDVMSQWVGQMIEDVIDQINNCKLCELLYPYLHLNPTDPTLTQHRSICIVLMYLIKWNHAYNVIEPIHSLVFTYLTRTLTSSPDQWTQLFVLMALEDLKITEHEKRQIEACEKIGQMARWKKQFNEKDVVKMIKSGHKYRIQYKLYICSYNLLKSLNSNYKGAYGTITNPTATLNPHDLTPQLTLSPCHLSARSDWHWQSVRSVCQVSAHIYYFEVVLLTSGPMTIGWATKRTDLAKITKIYPIYSTPIMVGFDEFSIGFDGFNRCIYHDNKTFQLENIPRWKAGDIVGCLIDTNHKHFKFYLNGIPINFNPAQSPIFFSSQPYHSLISLSQFQQVYLNFGQFPFSSHRPKYIDFYDFYSNKPEVNEKQTKTVVNFNNANLERNLIITESNVKQGDVLITENAASNKSAALTETMGNISSKINLRCSEASTPNASQCNICRSSTPHSNSRFRFDCCNHMSLCHEQR